MVWNILFVFPDSLQVLHKVESGASAESSTVPRCWFVFHPYCYAPYTKSPSGVQTGTVIFRKRGNPSMRLIRIVRE